MISGRDPRSAQNGKTRNCREREKKARFRSNNAAI